MTSKERLADTIRAIREKLELSQVDLARRLKVHPTTLGRYESAERLAEPHVLTELMVFADTHGMYEQGAVIRILMHSRRAN